MNFGSAFAGIGGFDLGFERAGMSCSWQIEKNEFCRSILKKHWPNVPQFGDILDYKPGDLGHVDVVCAGFPCQDISSAGKKVGLHGQRSGLFFNLVSLCDDIKPKIIVLENSPFVYSHWETVKSSFLEIGYECEGYKISAADVGAPQRRERAIILAYSNSLWQLQQDRCQQGKRRWLTDCGIQESKRNRHYWSTEPRLDRMANGVPYRVDRERALGNAICPQVSEFIGRFVVDVLSDYYSNCITGAVLGV